MSTHFDQGHAALRRTPSRRQSTLPVAYHPGATRQGIGSDSLHFESGPGRGEPSNVVANAGDFERPRTELPRMTGHAEGCVANS